MKKILLSTLAMLIMCASASAQASDAASDASNNESAATETAKKKTKRPVYHVPANHWSLAGHVGVAFLDGDQHQDYNAMWPRSGVDCSFDIMAEYTFTPMFGIFLEYAYNPYRGAANYYFYGRATSDGMQRKHSVPIDFDGLSHEISAGMSINLLNMFYWNRSQKWNLFVNAGAGFSFYDVKAYERDTKNVLSTEIDGVTVAPSISKGRAVTFPIGAMLEYNPLRWLAIALNVEYRLHAKDNFDATEKGNANDNTIYMSLGLRWKINNPKHKEIDHVRNMSVLAFNGGEKETVNCCGQVAINTEKIAELEERLANIKPAEAAPAAPAAEPDDDMDGVPNSRDREPNTPPGSFVNTWGQALDKDAVERILGYGQYKGEVPAIYFETGKVNMAKESQSELAKIARKLFADPDLHLDIIGYCDNIGTDKVNISLSIKRAEEAKSQLVKRYGIDASRITTYGRGKTAGPVDNFAPNRRCDFILHGEGEGAENAENEESDESED